jgi:hypothetical protein
MIFPIYNNFTGIKSNFLVVQAEVTGESLGACDERFTRNDTQISKEWSVKWTFVLEVDVSNSETQCHLSGCGEKSSRTWSSLYLNSRDTIQPNVPDLYLCPRLNAPDYETNIHF